MNKRNREVNDKGDSILARWRLQEERELNLCNRESNREKGGKTHTERTQALALSHSLTYSLSLPTQLSERPVLAFSHLACIGGIHV